MNGDIISDLHYDSFFDEHVENSSIFTISSFERDEQVDYGVLSTENGLLNSLSEKPLVKYEVSMGIYMLSKEILGYIPKDQEFGFDQLMHSLLEDSKKVFVKKHTNYWLDIGRPSDYEIAINDYESKIKKYLF